MSPTRRRGARSSSAGRPRRPKRRRARAASSSGSRRQAYRRPATAADVDELMPFYERGAQAGGFEGGIRTALQAMLSSLHFLFRVEETPAAVKPGVPYRISDVDLASRLSFFLWGTIPDASSSTAARRGELVAGRHARAAGAADAGRRACRGAGHALRVAVAAPAGPAQGRARRAVVPVLRRVARRRDGARDGAALRAPRARGSAGARAADRRLHVRQRAPRAALRHRRRQRTGVPQGRRIPTTRGAACSGTAAS